MMPTGNCWGSWTTSCKIRTASSSSPHCTAAEGSCEPKHLCKGSTGQPHLPLDTASRSSVPLGCLLLCCIPELPLGREKRPGAKNEPFRARHMSREGEQTPEPSTLLAVEVGEGAPVICLEWRELYAQVTQLLATPRVLVYLST